MLADVNASSEEVDGRCLGPSARTLAAWRAGRVGDDDHQRDDAPSPRDAGLSSGRVSARPVGATPSSCFQWQSSGSSSSTRSGTRSTSASSSGNPREGPGRRDRELPRPLRRPDLSPSGQEHDPVRARRRPPRDGARPADCPRDQPEDPWRLFFRSAFYFPSLASSAAITAIAIFILNANGLLNAIIGGNRAWFGDRAPLSGRSSASTRGRPRAR